MRLTREADYALRIVYDLTVRGELADAAATANTTFVTKRFTLKILRELMRAGIVKSQKGAGGGYLLAKSADHISVMQVMEAVEGPLTINQCLDENQLCERMPDKSACVFHCLFCALNAELEEKLKKVTLADAAEKPISEILSLIK